MSAAPGELPAGLPSGSASAVTSPRGGAQIPAGLAQAVPGKAAAENFPVAPRFLPRRVREDLMAIYGYARLVDDLGDEAVGDRAALLDAVDADLDAVFAAAGAPEHDFAHPIMARIADTIRRHDLPEQPFRRLVEANRQDQRVFRYASFDELVRYCELSANPVGRLVLGVFSVTTPARVAYSDDICTGLQLAEHWQDVAEDYAHGRIYLPAEDRARFGVSEEQLAMAPASDELRRLMAFEVRRAHELLDRGAPLIGTLPPLPRLAVAAFLAGGRAALHAITAADFDVTSATRTPRRRVLVAEALRAAGRGR